MSVIELFSKIKNIRFDGTKQVIFFDHSFDALELID